MKTNIEYINNSKFKENEIFITFTEEVVEKQISHKALLSIMLIDKCFKYSDKQKIRTKLHNLYGCNISSNTIISGNANILTIKSKIIDELYVDVNLYEEWIDFIHEIIYNPLFDEESLEEAKTSLINRIKRENEDPATYALKESMKIIGSNTSLQYDAYGSISEIEKTTLSDINDCYSQLLSMNTINLYVIGRNVLEKKKLIEDKFKFNTIKSEIELTYTLSKPSEEVYYQYKEISQSYIVMSYSTGVDIYSDSFYPLQLANIMFGGSTSSFLFQNVREKHSLCYSINSNISAYESLMYVRTGVNPNNVDKTIDLISENFNELKNINIDQEMFDNAKKTYINRLRRIDDSIHSIVLNKFSNNLKNCILNSEEIIEIINNITLEDIKLSLEKCELINIFILTNGGDSNE